MADGFYKNQIRRIEPSHYSSRIYDESANDTWKNSRPKRRRYSFFAYVKAAFRDSLITSFPQIVTTKSPITRIWKILIFLLSVCGFLYQTWNFLVFYVTYPVTDEIEESSPFEVVQPAFTFCEANIIRRTDFCKSNESNCIFEKDLRNFCRKYEKYCEDDSNVYTGVPNKESYSMESTNTFSWEEMLKFGSKPDFFAFCFKKVGHDQVDCNIRPVPFVTKSGKPTICYTVESQLEQPDSVDEVYPNILNFEIFLKTFPGENFYYIDPQGFYFSIHDRRDTLNPYVTGNYLERGRDYIAHVSSYETIRLPPPYRTNCTDYLSLWRKNNGSGPLNEAMCIESCKINKAIALNQCVDKYTSYPHYEPICRFYDEGTSINATKECTMECQPACHERTYEVKLADMDLFTHMCVDDPYCQSRFIFLYISFRKYQRTRHIYQEKYNSVELFSYIGGFMGMWLGLSLVSMLDFIESVCYLLYYPTKKFGIFKRNLVNA